MFAISRFAVTVVNARAADIKAPRARCIGRSMARLGAGVAFAVIVLVTKTVIAIDGQIAIPVLAHFALEWTIVGACRVVTFVRIAVGIIVTITVASDQTSFGAIPGAFRIVAQVGVTFGGRQTVSTTADLALFGTILGALVIVARGRIAIGGLETITTASHFP